jgi:hypothetical protein
MKFWANWNSLKGAPPQTPKRKSPRTPSAPLDRPKGKSPRTPGIQPDTPRKRRDPAQLDDYADLPVPPTPSALATLVKEIKSTKVLESDSQFAKELIKPQGQELGQVLDDAVMAAVNNTFEHECLEDRIALLSTVPCGDLHAYAIQGPKYTLKQFPEVRFLANQIWAIWFIVW